MILKETLVQMAVIHSRFMLPILQLMSSMIILIDVWKSDTIMIMIDMINRFMLQINQEMI